MTTNTKTNENVERNKELYKDFYSGEYNGVQLVAKYQITSATIYEIIRRMDKKNENLK